MMRNLLKCVIFLTILSFLAGCAVSHYSQGRKHLAEEDYDAAIEAFEMALKENPEDAKILRELGIVYYGKTDFEKAIPLLLQAFLKDSTDGRTLFYLGTAYEITHNIRFAIDIYRRYVDVSRFRSIRSSIEARMVRLALGQMEEEIRGALAQEQTLDATKIPENTIAVFSFKNMGENRDLDPIQKGLADMLITDFSKVRRLKVVERIRMQKLVQEMGLGSTGLVDDGTAPRAAKLLGASRLVMGSFVDLTAAGLRVDAGLIHSLVRQPMQSGSVEGKLTRLFQMEKDLVFRLVDLMGISLSQQERDEIEIIPTENILAFMAYCRGLDFEDRGMYRQAAEAYGMALEFDPEYTEADRRRSRSESLSMAEVDVSELERQFAEASTRAEPEGMSPLASYMRHTGEMMNRHFLPGVESRKPIQEQSGSSFGNSANISVSIPLPENR